MKIANKVRAIGLIETNVGGTPDQHWSSPDAIAQCENKGKPWDWPAGYKDSVMLPKPQIYDSIQNVAIFTSWGLH